MSVYIENFADQIAFQPGRFNPVVLAETEYTKVILVCLEPGQFIPVHRPGVDLTLVVMEGKGQIVAGEDEQSVEPGAVAFVPAGEARGIKAETRLVLMHVVTPPPTDEDHVQVMAGLKRGAWR
ncbi:MAG: cupin domain-containing protein [Caldilineaceae bacterium]|nr:cupin domain-containing protein [Caldilineaceae bacterium]HRJ41740.1 cupin domain-containing protein [Caldilineaceae bacterium]